MTMQEIFFQLRRNLRTTFKMCAHLWGQLTVKSSTNPHT
jgi:hypothetical protein